VFIGLPLALESPFERTGISSADRRACQILNIYVRYHAFSLVKFLEIDVLMS